MGWLAVSIVSLNMKVLVGAFNQEKALVGAFSVIVKTNCETDGLSAALVVKAWSQTLLKRSACGYHPFLAAPPFVYN